MQPTQHYPEPTVGALIFDPAGHLFLMKSHKWGGQYVVPGGHVELGETLEATLRREAAAGCVQREDEGQGREGAGVVRSLSVSAARACALGRKCMPNPGWP